MQAPIMSGPGRLAGICKNGKKRSVMIGDLAPTESHIHLIPEFDTASQAKGS
jgi:hypothetical protein